MILVLIIVVHLIVDVLRKHVPILCALSICLILYNIFCIVGSLASRHSRFIIVVNVACSVIGKLAEVEGQFIDMFTIFELIRLLALTFRVRAT